jgi:hypothetical protein
MTQGRRAGCASGDGIERDGEQDAQVESGAALPLNGVRTS